ncbi:hypothetical protein BD779DRAFT_978628 [Infundibulicybe gibba]|nr:hypothetical protein BD779DRAFT_978628 [Infundibulicybe gibba]
MTTTCYYYRTFARDPLSVKFLVGFLILLDTTHTLCLIHGVYAWFFAQKLLPIFPPTIIATLFITYVALSNSALMAVPFSTSIPMTIYGTIELGSSVLGDVAISASLVYFLHTRRTGFQKTENLVDKLILYSVNVGLVTSAFAIIVLIMWLVFPLNFDFAPFHLTISKLYINSFLASLNSREAKGTTWIDSNNTSGHALSDVRFEGMQMEH